MIELLRKRRRIRKFLPEKVTPGLVDIIIEAALKAFSIGKEYQK